MIYMYSCSCPCVDFFKNSNTVFIDSQRLKYLYMFYAFLYSVYPMQRIFITFFCQFIDCLKMINCRVTFSETGLFSWFLPRIFSIRYRKTRISSLYTWKSRLIGLQSFMSPFLCSIILASFHSAGIHCFSKIWIKKYRLFNIFIFQIIMTSPLRFSMPGALLFFMSFKVF